MILKILLVLAMTAGLAMADVTSYTGTLASSEDVAEFTIALASAGTVTLQTYGFGGGTNGAGTAIAAGGTDPFLAIFQGTGGTASIVTDGSLNPYGTSLDLSNYAQFQGCGPAGAPAIGGSAQCGDIDMTLWLAAGTYTVVLSDGDYIANAVFDDGTLGEGFSDLTGGGFCNLSINGVDCPNTSGAYALDITEAGGEPNPIPEPSAVALVGTVLAGLAFRRRLRSLARTK